MPISHHHATLDRSKPLLPCFQKDRWCLERNQRNQTRRCCLAPQHLDRVLRNSHNSARTRNLHSLQLYADRRKNLSHLTSDLEWRMKWWSTRGMNEVLVARVVQDRRLIIQRL